MEEENCILSIIQSIPKDLKDTAIPNNYCGIVLGFLSQKIIGTVHLDVISKIFLHIRFAVWVQEGLLYRPQDYCTGLLKLVSSQVKGSMSSVRYEQSL